jgi:hypothetical protein
MKKLKLGLLAIIVSAVFSQPFNASAESRLFPDDFQTYEDFSEFLLEKLEGIDVRAVILESMADDSDVCGVCNRGAIHESVSLSLPYVTGQHACCHGKVFGTDKLFAMTRTVNYVCNYCGAGTYGYTSTISAPEECHGYN